MAFAMSLPRTKRVKVYQADGTETFQEEDRWSLVRAVHSTEQDGTKKADENQTAAGKKDQAPVLPVEALEKLQMARGELDMTLDLIEMLEAQQHMGIENVPPQKSTLQQLTRQKDLRLQTKLRQLKDAAERIQNGSQGLALHLQLENRYFDDVAELALDWRIKPNPGFPSSGAPFQVDISIASAEYPTDATQKIDLQRSKEGACQVFNKAGALVTGPEAVDKALTEWQDDLNWAGLQFTLNQEAQASSRSSAAQTLVTELLQSLGESTNVDLQELKALLTKAYLQGLAENQKTGTMPKLLPRANAWLRHKWFSQHVEHSLRLQAKRWHDQHNEAVHVSRRDIPGVGRSLLEVAYREELFHLIIKADTLEVRGVALGAVLDSRSAASSVLPSLGRQEVDSLLQRLLTPLANASGA